MTNGHLKNNLFKPKMVKLTRLTGYPFALARP